MKLFSPDGALLIEVRAVKPYADGIMIEGMIMGAMPMQALLKPGEMRAGRKLLTWKVMRGLSRMLFSRSKRRADPHNA